MHSQQTSSRSLLSYRDKEFSDSTDGLHNDSETRICGGITMPPEKSLRFDKPLRHKFSATCVTISGMVDLRDGTFFFRDCVFDDYTIKGLNVMVRFERCIFQKDTDRHHALITIEGDSVLTLISCVTKQINGFLRIKTLYGCRHYIYNMVITGSKASNIPWSVIECDSIVEVDGIHVTYTSDNCYNSQNNSYMSASGYIDNKSTISPSNIFALFDLSRTLRGTPFTVKNASVNVITNADDMGFFIRGTNDSLIYITQCIIVGLRALSLIPSGDITMIDQNNQTSLINQMNNPISVPIIPPGGGIPVIVGVNPTGNPLNGVQTATIISGSAGRSPYTNIRLWPWPQPVFITHSDMSLFTPSNIAIPLIETIGDNIIGLQHCNIITNGLNTPIVMRDAINIILNVIGTNIRGAVDTTQILSTNLSINTQSNNMTAGQTPLQLTPWVRLERIRQIARIEYSSATSYIGLGAITTVEVGILMVMPAGSIA